VLPSSRRHFLLGSLGLVSSGLLAGCGVCVPWTHEPGRPRRIGFLSSQHPDPDPCLEVLRVRLRELGWVDGQNLTIETRYAAGRIDHLPELARELIRLEVELIHAAGTAAALAVLEVSQAVPIVIATAGDPVTQGLVASLAHPGGSVTGLTSLAPELTAKRIELLKELVPGMARLGVLKNPTQESAATYRGFLRGAEEGAKAAGLQIQWASVSGPDRPELEAALSKLAREAPEAVLIISDPTTSTSTRAAMAPAPAICRSRWPCMMASKAT
jgi:putative tryptophan/tyrosine transport system substrate-binding protein